MAREIFASTVAAFFRAFIKGIIFIPLVSTSLTPCEVSNWHMIALYLLNMSVSGEIDSSPVSFRAGHSRIFATIGMYTKGARAFPTLLAFGGWDGEVRGERDESCLEPNLRSRGHATL
jgi:hypothetical protein